MMAHYAMHRRNRSASVSTPHPAPLPSTLAPHFPVELLRSLPVLQEEELGAALRGVLAIQVCFYFSCISYFYFSFCSTTTMCPVKLSWKGSVTQRNNLASSR